MEDVSSQQKIEHSHLNQESVYTRDASVNELNRERLRAVDPQVIEKSFEPPKALDSSYKQDKIDFENVPLETETPEASLQHNKEMSANIPSVIEQSLNGDKILGNERRDSNASLASSILSLTILRKRLGETVALFPKSTESQLTNSETLRHPRVPSYSGTASHLLSRREKRGSLSINSSLDITRRLTRKTMSATDILRISTYSNQTQSVAAGSRRNSQGVQLYERRRNAVPKPNKNGNIAYSERKNMRRGSLFAAQQMTRSKLAVEDRVMINDIEIPVSGGKRQSLQLPSQAFGRRSSGDSIISEGSSDSGAAVRNQLAPNLNRRRRSRAPASLAEDLQFFVPRPSNPEAREKVRRFFIIVKVCVSLCRWSYSRAEEKKESVLGFAQVDSEEHNLEKLFFNPSYFKANRQQRLTDETKYILTLASWKRTKEQIRYVQIALRNIRAFAEYPIDMQLKLSRVGWLEEYGPKRVILRQGHLPDAFYFIITGTLVVTVLDLTKGKPMAQTVAFLKRGDSFGELAILNDTRRASTVITRDTVQMLCISVEDFEDIFMLAGGMKSVNDPTRNTFIRELNMFQHWPFYHLADHPQDCLFHFFKYGDVLVKDSRYSDWIYIIKSGSCSVLKKLKRKPPKIPSKLRRATPAAMIWNKGNQLGLVGASSSHMSSRKQCKKRNMLRHRRHSWPTVRHHRTGNRTTSATALKTNDKNKKDVTPPANSNGKGVYIETSLDDAHGIAKGTQPAVKYRQGSNTNETPDGLDEDVPKDFVENKRTFHSDLDGPKMEDMKDETDADDDSDPVFIVVQVLNRGSVFGLHGEVFTEQPNVSVVSNGAECILIRKRFYLEHATDETFAFLRRRETPYPSNAELQEKLQIYKNWNCFRNHTLKSAVYETRAHKQQRLVADAV